MLAHWSMNRNICSNSQLCPQNVCVLQKRLTFDPHQLLIVEKKKPTFFFFIFMHEKKLKDKYSWCVFFPPIYSCHNLIIGNFTFTWRTFICYHFLDVSSSLRTTTQNYNVYDVHWKEHIWRRNHKSNVLSSTLLLPTQQAIVVNVILLFVPNDFDERVPYFFRFWFMKFLKFHLPPSTFLKIVFLTRPFFPKCNFCLSFLLENRYVANIVSKKWRKSRLQKNCPATNSKFPNQQRVVVVPLFCNDSRGAKVCKET